MTTCTIYKRVETGVMSFLLCMVTQMMRSNFYTAIVGMVDSQSGNINNGTAMVGMVDSQIGNMTSDIAMVGMVDCQIGNMTSDENVTCISKKFLLPSESLETSPTLQPGNMDWSEATQGVILGSFYWCSWMSEVPGGIMAQRYGAKKVLGISVFIAGALNAVIPWATQFHVGFLIAIRAVQGLALGVISPALHTLAAQWIPVHERSKYMNIYHGDAVGSALASPLSSSIMQNYGWMATFYITSSLNILWVVGCKFFIYDNPEKHPRITSSEKTYLRRQLFHLNNGGNKKGSLSTPWWKICKSTAFWANLIGSLGISWGSFTLNMMRPTFLKNQLDFTLGKVGILTGVPEMTKFLFGSFFSTVLDHFLLRKLLSVTSGRKLAMGICEGLPAAILLMLYFITHKESPVTSVVLLTLASTFSGASSSGALANILDISPQHAGVILGMIKTVTSFLGIITPSLTGFLTAENKPNGWNNVFLLVAIFYIISFTVFIIFGTAKIQPWNNMPDCNETDIPLEEINLPDKVTNEEEEEIHETSLC